MSLLLDAARWIASKVLAVALIALVVSGVALLWEWERERGRLAREAAGVRLEVESALRDWRAHRGHLLDAERLVQQLEAARPNPILAPNDYLAWRARLQAAEAAVGAATAARDRAKEAYDGGRKKLAGLQDQLATISSEWQASLHKNAWIIAIAVLAFLLGPVFWSGFWYYAVAPLASRASPLVVLPPGSPGRCTALPSAKILDLEVQPGCPLVIRMDWLQQYAPALEKRTRLLYDWRSPLISYASGLREMTEVRVKPGEPAGRVSLTAAADPHAYLLALQLEDHPGVILRPGVVVAVSGAVRMRSRWRFGSLHAWVAGRVRHILFSGTGTVVVAGHGGVDWCSVDAPVAIEEALVLGADGRTAFEAVRTETFWPYLRGRTSLFDYRFSRGQAFLRQTSVASAGMVRRNALTRSVEAMLNGVGKLLGF